MTQKCDPTNRHIKFEVSAKLLRDFDWALERAGMHRGRAAVIRRFIAEYVDMVRDQFEKKAAATITK